MTNNNKQESGTARSFANMTNSYKVIHKSKQKKPKEQQSKINKLHRQNAYSIID